MGDEGFIEMMANNIIRKKLNDVFGSDAINPDNLVVAINSNLSLWSTGEDEIKRQAESIPGYGYIVNIASDYMETIDKKYGGFTKLTLSFLKEDHPDLFSIIINTPNGEEWLDRQVNDILRGIGIKD